jgi:hypothetical protein
MKSRVQQRGSIYIITFPSGGKGAIREDNTKKPALKMAPFWGVE